MAKPNFGDYNCRGRSFNLSIDQIKKNKGYGEPLNLMIGVGNVSSIVSIFPLNSNSKGLIFSNRGSGFLVDYSSLQSSTKTGKQIFELNKNDKVIGVRELTGDKIIVLSTAYKMLVFSANQLPYLKKGKGVRIQRYKDEELLDIIFYSESDKNNLVIKKLLTYIDNLSFWFGKRGQVGKTLPKKLLRKKITKFEDLL